MELEIRNGIALKKSQSPFFREVSKKFFQVQELKTQGVRDTLNNRCTDLKPFPFPGSPAGKCHPETKAAGDALGSVLPAGQGLNITAPIHHRRFRLPAQFGAKLFCCLN